MVWQRPVAQFSMRTLSRELSFCSKTVQEQQLRLSFTMARDFGYARRDFPKENFIGGPKAHHRAPLYYKRMNSRLFSGMAILLEDVFQRHGRKSCHKKHCFCTILSSKRFLTWFSVMERPNRLEFTPEQIEALLDRISSQKLEEEDFALLANVVQAMLWMEWSLKEKQLSIYRLKSIFGIKTESAKKLAALVGQKSSQSQKKEQGPESDSKDEQSETGQEKEQGKSNEKSGHGHRPASNWQEAKIINVAHESLKKGDLCSKCGKGKLFNLKPGTVLCISGQPWLQASIYKAERLRCSACGQTFTAKLPSEIMTQTRSDEYAKTIVTILKYKGGVPFYRQGKLNDDIGTPLSPTEIFEMTSYVADCAQPIHGELCELAAQAPLLHNDDTPAKVLELIRENKKEQPKRQGMFTTAILATFENYKIGMYFTGRQYAGENLEDLLDRREKTSGTPIQMCDALPSNEPGDHETYLSNCNAHARRKFYELASINPREALHFVSLFDQVFLNDRMTKEMSPSDRLKVHQEKSLPIMQQIRDDGQKLLEDKKVEPNSSLGKAIRYTENHWDALTLFTRMEGVPVSNNDNERMMKLVQRNRKNALFFKTQEGARIADVLLSIIETCMLNKANPYDYLIRLQQHRDEVKADPESWLPWNYLAKLPPKNQVDLQ
jgi:transposase